MKRNDLLKDSKAKDKVFQFIVVKGIYLILLAVTGFQNRAKQDAELWRGEVLDYYDTFGNQSEGSDEYRREKTFPTFWP